LGDITHDIVNHLASIKAYAQILLIKLKGGPVSDDVFSPAEALKSIEELESENIKLLSTLSRFAQKRKEKHELTEINKIIEDVILLVSPVARKSNIEMTAELTPELPSIIVDKSQIQEALVILALGAIESIPNTGTVVIRTALSIDKEFIEVTIIDSGSQRQDYLTKMTAPFFTADHQVHGLTVGHTIVEELVARHTREVE
jgi:C4-dicarboxylate-specific signal transduction histidine kinase